MHLASKPAEQQVLLIVTLCRFLPEFFFYSYGRKSTQNVNHSFTCNSKINPIIHDSEDIFDIT